MSLANVLTTEGAILETNEPAHVLEGCCCTVIQKSLACGRMFTYHKDRASRSGVRSVEGLESCRKRAAGVPIAISCGGRDINHNREVLRGKTSNSVIANSIPTVSLGQKGGDMRYWLQIAAGRPIQAEGLQAKNQAAQNNNRWRTPSGGICWTQ